MAIDFSGVLKASDMQGEVYNDLSYFVQLGFPNESPLLSRLSRAPVDTPTYITRHRKQRARLYTLSANVAGGNAGDLSTISFTQQNPADGLQLGDDSQLMPGDVLELGDGGERVQVRYTASYENATLPNIPAGVTKPNPGSVIVERGVEGTTVAAFTATSANARLIGNARPEVNADQPGIYGKPIEVTQYNQLYLYPAQVSYVAQATRINGVNDLYAAVRNDQLINMMRDMEVSSLYGLGEAPNPNDPVKSAKQKGVKVQITTNKKLANTVSNPGQYTPDDLQADALTPLYDLGGNPDFLMCSTSVLNGINKWAGPLVRIEAGSSLFGTKIDTFVCPVATNLSIIPNRNMRPGSYFVGEADKIKWRQLLPEQWQERGKRGTLAEGDYFGMGSIQIEDQERFAWVEGISAFAKP